MGQTERATRHYGKENVLPENGDKGTRRRLKLQREQARREELAPSPYWQPKSVRESGGQGEATATRKADRSPLSIERSTMALSESLQAQAVRELADTKCPVCETPKRRGHSFCSKCFFSLDAGTRQSLYATMAEGYPSIYDEAKTRLIAERP